MRRVALGADPGTASLGLGVLGRAGSSVELLAAVTVHPKGDTLTEKEREIYQRATALIREHRPLVFGVEDQSGVSTAARMNQKRQIEAARRGVELAGFGFNASNDGVIEVVGVLKAAAFAYGVPIVLLQPRSIKLGILGPGFADADKKLIKQRLCLIMPALANVRVSLNATDALACAFCAERQSFQETARAG